MLLVNNEAVYVSPTWRHGVLRKAKSLVLKSNDCTQRTSMVK